MSKTASPGNGARFAAMPLAEGGTPVQKWLSADRLPLLDLDECTRLVVVAPHPDDETLGLGAMVAQLIASGMGVQDVQVISVSDGGAAVPGVSSGDRARLEAMRRSEILSATKILGIQSRVSLGLPDGQLAEHEERLSDVLVEILRGATSRTWCAATWRGDGHPDHEAVGRAAAAASAHTGATLLEYPVWMWHWACPHDPAVPWHRAAAVPVSRWAIRRKQQAAQCFRSQFEPLAPGAAPVLPSFVLTRLMAVGEVVFR